MIIEIIGGFLLGIATAGLIGNLGKDKYDGKTTYTEPNSFNPTAWMVGGEFGPREIDARFRAIESWIDRHTHDHTRLDDTVTMIETDANMALRPIERDVEKLIAQATGPVDLTERDYELPAILKARRVRDAFIANPAMTQIEGEEPQPLSIPMEPATMVHPRAVQAQMNQWRSEIEEKQS